MQNTPRKPRFTAIKYLLGSLVLAAAIWFWGLFSNKAIENLNQVSSSTTNDPNSIQPVVILPPSANTQVQAASNPLPALPSVHITVNNSHPQPVVQTITIPAANSASAPSAVTSTSSSR